MSTTTTRPAWRGQAIALLGVSALFDDAATRRDVSQPSPERRSARTRASGQSRAPTTCAS